MQIFHCLEDFPQHKKASVLTLGSFNGVHRGHALILKECQKMTPSDEQNVVLTFKNHPSEVLQPNHPVPLLCTLPHKLKLIETFGIDNVVVIPFTTSLAKQTAATFIEKIRQFIPFSHLILGYKAVMGRDLQEDRLLISKLASQWGFTIDYLDEYRYEGKSISSSRIKELLREGHLTEVESLLNRPYSIYSTVLKGSESSNIQLNVSNLCLPPNGKYHVTIQINNKMLTGVAYIDKKSLLKIECSDLKQDLVDKFIEIIFHS